MYQNQNNTKLTSGSQQNQSLIEVVTSMHQTVLEIQSDLKDIKIEMEGFKAKLADIEFDVENIKNSIPNYQSLPPSNESNADMDLTQDAYG